MSTMQPPLTKPCRICGEPVTPRRRAKRPAYTYPAQCEKCRNVWRDRDATCRKMSIAKSGMNHSRAVPLFTEGISSYGGYEYIIIKVRPTKGWVLKHRWVMEQHLGRKLKKGEFVHHIDGNTLNNVIENLQVISSGCHTQLHTIIPEWSKKFAHCAVCGLSDSPHQSRGVCHRCYTRQRSNTRPS